MEITWENKYVIFDTKDGPKTMIDTLNTEGNEGWELAAIVSVMGDKLCVFLKKATHHHDPTPEEEEKEEALKLWGGK
tara:strand:+ start:2313 stop:2543 length:231 start_codon:yes stop_codon:yes gene_type:complete